MENGDTKQRAEHRNVKRTSEHYQTNTSTHEELRQVADVKNAKEVRCEKRQPRCICNQALGVSSYAPRPGSSRCMYDTDVNM